MKKTVFSQKEREQLQYLKTLLDSFGNANDALDHGYEQAGREIREGAAESILTLIDDQPFVSELIPELIREVESGNIYFSTWSSLSDKLTEMLKD